MCAKVGNKMCLYKKKIKSNNGDLKSESLQVPTLNEMTECNKIMIHRVKYFYE